MKRNLKFWTRFFGESMEAVLIAAGVLAAISLLGAEGVSWPGAAMAAALFPCYLIFSVLIMNLMLSPGTQMLYVALLLSFGETRRNVFWGFQYYRFLNIAVPCAAAALFWSLTSAELELIRVGLQCLPAIVTVMVLVSAVGGLMGTAFIKWKGLGVAILTAFCGGCGGLIGWLGATGDMGDIYKAQEDILSVLSGRGLPWPFLAVTAGLLVLDLTLQWLTLRRREAKL